MGERDRRIEDEKEGGKRNKRNRRKKREERMNIKRWDQKGMDFDYPANNELHRK